jgi:glycopeptide antibiotics resistance protein
MAMKKLFAVLAAMLLSVLMGCSSSSSDPIPRPKSSEKSITSFSLNDVAGTINETERTIAIAMPFGTDVKAMVATFITTGANVKVDSTAQVSGTTVNDFTNQVTYTVAAVDSSTQDYSVTVTVALSSAKAITSFSLFGVAGTINETNKTIAVTMPFGTSLKEMIASLTTTGVSVKIGSIVQTNNSSHNDFTSPVIYTVTAADETTQDYTIMVKVALSSAKAITAFSLNGSVGTINQTGKTIAVTFPFGTYVSDLVATFTTTGANVKVDSTVQVSGSTAHNFTSPVKYTVTAADSTTQDYIVTVTVAASPAKSITSFSLNGVAGTINETVKTIVVIMPFGIDVTALVATFTTTGSTVKVGTTQQISGTTPNNFTSSVQYTVTAKDGSTAIYIVSITMKTYLPTITINTTDAQEITSKEFYVTGTYKIAGLDGSILHEGSLEIKGRGHSTWDMPKKPYRLKLTDKAALMGMPSNKHWVLLANYADKTLMRNDLAFKLSQMLGMEYTPRSVHVELSLNGSYQGVYQLTEHIRIGTDRINIPELKVTDTSEDKISGGYLIEVDARRGEDFCFDSTKTSMVFCLSSPETLLESGWEEQKQYIVNYVNQTDEAIFGDQFKDTDTGYAAYIDVDSAIQYYLINELFKNVDAGFIFSSFLFKKRNGKLFFGPIWDFDFAIGNVDYGGADNPEGWHILNAPWYKRMFEDPAFELKVKTRWKQMKTAGMLDALFQHIDNQTVFFNDAQGNNFNKWPILSVYVWPNRVVTGSYQGEIDAMKEWLALRIAWMDAQLSD